MGDFFSPTKRLKYSRTKSSTNGTWVFCTHSFPIKNKMDVEILNKRIQITEELKEK